jgi:uncharacterized protein (TIGR02453 family)
MWPAQAIEFLRDLEDNNDRDWFKANRSRYDDHLLAPARAFAAELTELGPPRFFRPYNDTRFHMRPPIKEHLGVAFGSMGAGVYYFELSLDGLLVAAGMHQPAPDQLERFRAMIADGRRAAAFERALATAQDAGLTLAEPALKRAPRGYPLDHPRIDRLRLKTLTVSQRHSLAAWIHKPRCEEVIREQLLAARPLVRVLSERVGPTQRGRT